MFFCLTPFFLTVGGFTEMVVDRWKDRWTERQADGRTDGHKNERTKGLTDGWTDPFGEIRAHRTTFSHIVCFSASPQK